MRIVRIGVLACAMVFAMIATSSATERIFVFVPDIQGEVIGPPSHLGWIEAESISWGHGEAPAGAPVKIQFQRLQLVKRNDSTSPALALLAASGKLIKDIKVELLGTSRDSLIAVARVKLTNARVTSVVTSASQNNRTDSIGFSFDTITWITFKVNAQGQQPGGAACWDVVNNRSCAPTF